MQNEFLSLVYDLHNCGSYKFFFKIKFTVTYVDLLFNTCYTYHYILSNLQLIAMCKVFLTFHHKIIIIKKGVFLSNLNQRMIIITLIIITMYLVFFLILNIFWFSQKKLIKKNLYTILFNLSSHKKLWEKLYL